MRSRGKPVGANSVQSLLAKRLISNFVTELRQTAVRLNPATANIAEDIGPRRQQCGSAN
jgi:hypothetical protein